MDPKRLTKSRSKSKSDDHWEVYEGATFVGYIIDCGEDGWGWEYWRGGQMVVGGTVQYQTEAYRKLEGCIDGAPTTLGTSAEPPV